MKYLIAGTGGVGGSIADSVAGRQRQLVLPVEHLQSIQTNQFETESI